MTGIRFTTGFDGFDLCINRTDRLLCLVKTQNNYLFATDGNLLF